MAVRRIVAATEEGGRPYHRPFRPFAVALSGGSWPFDPVGDSGDDGDKLQRGSGGGARPGDGRSSWAGVRLMFAEELEKNYRFVS